MLLCEYDKQIQILKVKTEWRFSKSLISFETLYCSKAIKQSSNLYSRNDVIDSLGNDVFDRLSVGLRYALKTDGERRLSSAAVKPARITHL